MYRCSGLEAFVSVSDQPGGIRVSIEENLISLYMHFVIYALNEKTSETELQSMNGRLDAKNNSLHRTKIIKKFNDSVMIGAFVYFGFPFFTLLNTYTNMWYLNCFKKF